MSAEALTQDKYAEIRGIKTGLRSDLKITRSKTRGVATYVIFDPVKFQTHRLSLNDYLVAGSLGERRTLQQAFEDCVDQGLLDLDDEDLFFGFVSQLKTLGLLGKSKEDSSSLYQKFQRREESKQKNAVFSLLFATIPLSNPDKFLDETIDYVSWLFTRTALILSGLMGVGALMLVIHRFHDFVSPLNGILATNNLFFLAVSFVALKIIHEFGHGYACKKYGGSVPEMGCKLIVMMPLAYVDATSAWSFPKKSHRLFVMLAGMYVEAIVAIVGIYIWALDPHSFIGSCAYQLVFMAGVATVLFNANPLMKYDGYFVLSDTIGIPNLRTRSTNYLNGLLKRLFLGIPFDPQCTSADKTTLLVYGVSATVYSTVLTVSIAFMIATMFGPVGIILAIYQLFSMLWKSISGYFRFLWSSPETEPVRRKSRMIAIASAIFVPLLLAFCPVPGRIVVTGVTSGTELHSIRSPEDGFVAAVSSQINQQVDKDQVLIELGNLNIKNNHLTQSMNAELARQKAISIARSDPAEAKKLESAARESLARMKVYEKDVAGLTIKAPASGRLMYIVEKERKGSFIQAGELVAKIVAGTCKVRAWVSENQLSESEITLQQKIELRLADRPLQTFPGRIISLAPAKRDEFVDLALTSMGKGGIKINPETGETEENMYMLEIEVPDLAADEILLDSRVSIVIKRHYQTLANSVTKSLQRFCGKLTL
ncbi:MAG: HlyD family efflux transporter periplasmic adaptor subunit [Planctomycetota bacterium]